MNNLESNNTQQQGTGESKGVAMNIFAILGFIAILLAGLWATTELVKMASNFSFGFNKSQEVAQSEETVDDTTPADAAEPTTTTDEPTTSNEPAPVSKPATTTTKPQASYTRTVRTVVPVRTSDPSGMPDLSISVTHISVDKSTNLATAKIDVVNQGTKMVQGWALSAVLPTEPAYTYTSTPQQALYAGETAEMILTFDKVKAGVQTLTITVDPYNAITESLETNNSAVVKLLN